MDRTWDATDHSLPAAGTPSSLAVPVVGATIGHFVVRAVLGQGGMGTVVEGYDPDLDRAVAIKVVRDRAAGSAAGRRLVREAQAMARLTHPNVVGVHEVGTIDRQVYLAMEARARHGTLHAWLKRKRPARPRASSPCSARPARAWPRPTRPAWSTATSSRANV
jgi:serine/threonine protein kinase